MCSCFQLTQADSEDLSQPNVKVSLNTIIYSQWWFHFEFVLIVFCRFSPSLPCDSCIETGMQEKIQR